MALDKANCWYLVPAMISFMRTSRSAINFKVSANDAGGEVWQEFIGLANALEILSI